MISDFLNYLDDQKIEYELLEDYDVVLINDESFQYVDPDENGLHINEEFEFVHKDIECDYIALRFGGRYYYSHPTEIELVEFKYLGKSVSEIPTPIFLGVHGGYELLRGSRDYSDWVKKAQFLGVESLGIVEKNTLAGLVKFQQECLKKEIHPVLGVSYSILKPSGEVYDVKLFIKDEIGWENVLQLNYLLNTGKNNKIKEGDLLSRLEGVILILDPKTLEFDHVFPIDLGEDIYYQLDTVEFLDEEHDEWYLKNLEKFVKSKYEPVSMTDAYYLDKEDSEAKFILESIGSSFSYESENQYFKDKEDYFLELSMLFDDSEKLYELFMRSTGNEIRIAESCHFKVDLGSRHLPEYVMTEEEAAKYEDNEELFFALIEDGLQRLYPDYTEEHLKRIETEVEVLKLGKVIDYFLITRDIINAATKEGILTGVARGSAGGSIISYLLGIIKIDPLQFGLIFERFLNKGRVTVSLPDIDSDFEGEGRAWVKEYMEKRFGETQVCSVGTYTTLKLKGAIKDVSRIMGVEFSEANIVTACIDGLEDETITDLFKRAKEEPKLKRFIKQYSNVIHMLPLVMNQPKARSVHACAMIIFPSSKKMTEWVPIRLQDGMHLTEWEGVELDEAGFLKLDILGIKQLDKFKSILKRIEENGKKVPDIYHLFFDDEEVYNYFGKGWNGDVFQMGSEGLTGYSKKLKPSNIDDLIACVALYRPGAMENGFHESYIKRKYGDEEINYMWGCEESLKDTFGLAIYQEQIMKICVDVANFSLVEADDIRKAMGKKKLNVLLPYKEQFIDGATNNGCPKDEAEQMWEMMLEFTKYSFNRSHSAAYGVTAYISQWLKVHFPLEYWATAFSFAGEDDVPKFLAEVLSTGVINIKPVDINMSDSVMKDDGIDTIYWGLSSIKNVGEKATDQIIEKRPERGYKSLAHFIEVHNYKGSKVNKRVYEGLILSGAFDKLEGIVYPEQREFLLKEYWEGCKVKLDKNKSWYHKNKGKTHESWTWLLEQKRLSGFVFFNYEELCEASFNGYPFLDNDIMNIPQNNGSVTGVCGGIVVEVFERKSTKGDYLKLLIEINYERYYCLIWPEEYKNMDVDISELEGSLMLFYGELKFDPKYSGKNQMVANSNFQFKILN